MLPRVTTARFFTKPAMGTFPPRTLPIGRINMLATEWSSPVAINRVTGRKRPTNFPVKSLAARD